MVVKKYPNVVILCPRLKSYKKFQIRPIFVPWIQLWVHVKQHLKNSTMTRPLKNVKFSLMEGAKEIKTGSTHLKNAIIFANRKKKVAKDPKIMQRLIPTQKVNFCKNKQ